MLHASYMLYKKSFKIATHLCLFFWKEIKYSFMHFCHLLTNIPKTGRRNGSFHLILAGKNENYVHILWIAYCPKCSLSVLCPFMSNSDRVLKLTVEL